MKSLREYLVNIDVEVQCNDSDEQQMGDTGVVLKKQDNIDEAFKLSSKSQIKEDDILKYVKTLDAKDIYQPCTAKDVASAINAALNSKLINNLSNVETFDYAMKRLKNMHVFMFNGDDLFNAITEENKLERIDIYDGDFNGNDLYITYFETDMCLFLSITFAKDGKKNKDFLGIQK